MDRRRTARVDDRAVKRLGRQRPSNVRILGLALSVVAGIALRSFLFGLYPSDPISYAAVAVLLFISALIATALPLRRALRLDPAVTLRADWR